MRCLIFIAMLSGEMVKAIITSLSSHHITMLTRESVARAYNTLLDAEIDFETITADELCVHRIWRAIRLLHICIGE